MKKNRPASKFIRCEHSLFWAKRQDEIKEEGMKKVRVPAAVTSALAKKYPAAANVS